MRKLSLSSNHLQIPAVQLRKINNADGRLELTFLIMGLFVGTIVTLSLYMLSNSVLSVAAVPVIPQSFGNCSANV